MTDDKTTQQMKWYIVHTYSGFEQKVRLAIQERVKAAG